MRCDNETEISFMREVVGASASGDRILEKGSIPLNLILCLILTGDSQVRKHTKVTAGIPCYHQKDWKL